MFSYFIEVFFILDGQYVMEQNNWLKVDLKQVNDNWVWCLWVIVLGYCFFYCFNSDGDDCIKVDFKVWVGQVYV